MRPCPVKRDGSFSRMSLMSPSPRNRARALLLSTTLLAGCATSSAALTPSAPSGPPAPPAPAIHAVSAGFTEGSISLHVDYIIDQRTQTCWILTNPSFNFSPMSCCAARRVPEVRRLVTWESNESCAQAAPAAPPAPAAAPPPAVPGAVHP